MRYITTISFLLVSFFVFAQNNVSHGSIALILQERVGCIAIRARVEQPSEKPKVFIRCGRSNYNSEPLYIINGIPVHAKEVKDLDPKDIESIEILKDASATAIYGCRASSGVILITTKSASLRKIIIKDFLDGSLIAGATVTFTSQDQKKDTVMFVANDSGMVVTDKLRKGTDYQIQVSSAGYKKFTVTANKSNYRQELLLERDVVGIKEVVVVSYPIIRCSWVTCICSSITKCLLHLKKDSLAFSNSSSFLIIYPNPVQKGSTVTIDLKKENDEDLQLKVFSLDGRLLLSQVKKMYKGNNRFTVQAESKWPAGTYLVQLSDAKGKAVSTDKLIIQ